MAAERFLDTEGLRHLWEEKIKVWIPFLSRKTQSIPLGQVDSTSTSTAFTASIDGIDELRDGVCCYIRNDAISSSSNFTLNVNGLGAKPVYSNTEDAGRISTAWTADKTFLFVYNSSRVSGGCWDAYYGNTSVDESNLVHKTGAETITGEKTFTGGVLLNNSDLVFLTGQDKGAYIEAGENAGGTKMLMFADIEDDSQVLLSNIETPIQNDDAANKGYVDESVSSVAPWNKRISLPSDAVLSSGGQSVSVTMSSQSTTPPKGVYMVCGQAMILNQNSKSQQGHAILRYRLSSNGNYVNVAATSFTVPEARTSTHGGTYGASSVFIQGLATFSVKPSYIEFQLAVEVETDGSDSILAATAPSSGSYADAIDPSSVNDPSATNLVIYKIGSV